MRRAALTFAGCLLVVLVAAWAPDPGGAGGEVPTSASPATRVIGHSVRGRAIRAWRVGSARARTRILVVGAIHGDEPGGKALTRRLRGVRPPRGTALWLVDDLNPDGTAKRTRQNARGVDLNRNFPRRWRPAGRRALGRLPAPRSVR